MSINALEKALWQVGTSPVEAADFRRDPAAYAQRFRLEDQERAMLRSLDVGSLAQREVSTLLLLMAFIAVRGPGCIPDYMQSMHRAAPPAPA